MRTPTEPGGANLRDPSFMEPGGHTAHGTTVPYRLGKLERRGLIDGRWLDLGCAEGYWADALAEHGAREVVGIEPDLDRLREAQAREHLPSVRFIRGEAEAIPVAEGGFDGVLLNEVLEHVRDEVATLAESHRVLRPGGHLALFSPNRGFPVEGHGARLDDRRGFGHPVPLMPWLPRRLTRRFATARNYWPREMRALVRGAGFEIVEQGWALPQFELYRWMPEPAIQRFRAAVPRLERSPAAPVLAVSTYILARRPGGHPPQG